MRVRRKSLWRSKNSKNARKFANMRAAKERKRIEGLSAEPVMPDMAHVYWPKPTKPLFVVTVRCRDGEFVRIKIHDGLSALAPSPTEVLRRIGCVIKNYRP